MLDDQHGDVAWQLLDDIENDRGLGGRHTGRRFVQQQHGWLQAERYGDLDEALLAVRQFPHQRERVVRDVKLFQQVVGMFEDAAV